MDERRKDLWMWAIVETGIAMLREDAGRAKQFLRNNRVPEGVVHRVCVLRQFRKPTPLDGMPTFA